MLTLLKVLCVLSFCLLLPHGTRAQDIHWSQFWYNPLFLNPGNTGNYKGTNRFVANYRNQWKSVSIPFQTTAISAEHRLEKWRDLSLGAQFFHDVVGDGEFQTVEFLTSASIAHSFLDDLITLRPGITLGLNQRRLNPGAFFFDNQFDGTQFVPGLPTGELLQSDQTTNFTLSLGATANYVLPFTGNPIDFGISLFNINRPNQGFFTQKVKRDRRLNIQARYLHPLSKNQHILPAFQFNTQGKYKEFILGSEYRYILLDRLGDYRAVEAGLWYRTADAAILSLGLGYQSWHFGLSYDINLSSLLPASNGRGGIEFSLRYILTRISVDNQKRKICPDFI